MDAGEIRVKLSLDSSGLKTGLEQAKAGMIGWRDSTIEGARETAKWGAAIGAAVAPIVAVGAAAYATVEKFGAMADGINDLAYTTGLSTEKIQQLQYAAVLSNTEFSSVSVGINSFSLAIARAGDQSSDAAKAFSALGVTTEGRTYDQIWEDTAKSLVNVSSATERAELANALYGKSWKEMVPYIESYVRNAEEIEGIDYLTAEQLNDLETAKSSLDKLGAQVTIFEGKLVASGFDAYEKAANGYSLFFDAIRLDFQSLRTDIDANSRIWNAHPDFDPAAWSKSTGTTYTPPTTLNKPGTSAKTSATGSAFTDKYAGLTGVTLQLAKANEDLTSALEEQATAIKEGNLKVYDSASFKIASLREEIIRLNAALQKTPTTTTHTKSSAGLMDYAKMSGEEIAAAKGSYKGGSKNVQEKIDFWSGHETTDSGQIVVRVVAEEGTLAKKVGQQGA